jgi:hypothetical protein
MKRCPQCLFIYPESDQTCDFDQTPLVAVADSEIDSVTKPRGNKIKFVAIIAAAVIAFGVLAVYLAFKSANKQAQAATNIPVAVVEATPDLPVPSPSPSPSVSPSPSPSPTPKPSPTRVATAHTTTSVDPVSTSGPGIGTRRGSKPVILLTSGGKIEADEVWRTRDGVWYRKNGMVTLLKPGRVKAIVNK